MGFVERATGGTLYGLLQPARRGGGGGSEVLNYVKGEKGSPLKEEGIPLPRESPAPLFPSQQGRLALGHFFLGGGKGGT